MDFYKTDPEFMDQFMVEEVPQEPGQQLPEPTRHLAILATLLGCQGLEAFQDQLPQALEAGLTPVMVKELVYQAVDYLGWGRVKPFLTATNAILTARGVALPLPGQATTTLEDRLERGAETQAAIFGPHMLEAWKQNHIGAGGEPPHQPLAGGQLLWGLLHPHRPGPAPAGAHHLLPPLRPGGLRPPAHHPRQGKHAPGPGCGIPA